MQDITPQLKELFGDRLKEQEPLAKHVNYRIGGPARWFVSAKTAEEIAAAAKIAKDAGVPWFALGGGSNTLASDEGFDGLVIKMANRNVTITDTTVTADAGVISAALARQTAMAGLQGFEWAISLPGTVGGAARGNAGCFGGETKDVVTRVRVLRDGEAMDIPAADMRYGYRESAVKHNHDIILSVTMELHPGDAEALTQKLADTLAKRKASQPLHAGSAGCMFKNHDIESEDELQRLRQEADIPEAMLASRRLSAGWLVDQCDLKGTRIGDAMISEEHGNFIVNLGQATASDVVQLISRVKTAVRDRFGIQLEEEVQYLGF